MSTCITFGAWDLLHPGHLHFLRSIKGQDDELIVGLHVDPSIERPDTKEKPVQSLLERWYQLQCLDIIDLIIPYETEQDLRNILATTYPLHYYYLGSDYVDKELPKEVMHILHEKNITIEYVPRLHTFSSTDLRKRIRAKK